MSEIELNREGILTEEQRDSVRSIVAQFNNDPRHIYSLALLSRGILTSCNDVTCSKESRLEATFDLAFWTAVEELTKDKVKNKDTLSLLRERAALNDTEGGDWGRIVEGKNFP